MKNGKKIIMILLLITMFTLTACKAKKQQIPKEVKKNTEDLKEDLRNGLKTGKIENNIYINEGLNIKFIFSKDWKIYDNKESNGFDINKEWPNGKTYAYDLDAANHSAGEFIMIFFELTNKKNAEEYMDEYMKNAEEAYKTRGYIWAKLIRGKKSFAGKNYEVVDATLSSASGISYERYYYVKSGNYIVKIGAISSKYENLDNLFKKMVPVK